MLRFIRDFRAWLAFIGLLMSAPLCLGQFSGSIQGTVVDPSGATVPNAKLTLTNTATLVTSEAASDTNGNYRFASLAPGGYKLSATAPGFARTEVTQTPETVPGVTGKRGEGRGFG